MTDSLHDMLRHATRLTQSGQLAAATQAIQRALGAALPAGMAPAMPAEVIDVVAVEVPAAPGTDQTAADRSGASFTAGSHRMGRLQRGYKLYLPPDAAGRALPLVVMLHGCTQDPDDFAAGTGMNALAAAQGVAVLYPEQAQAHNPQRCWNWFKHSHQRAGRGEAALIAQMAESVVRQHGLDASRVYIAGLSAGGAMAALVAAAHPRQFAALGVHSGLAPGVAHDLPSGLAAMRGGGEGGTPLPLPTIVFHGDQDSTVHPRNAQQLLDAAIRGGGPAPAASAVVSQGTSAGGQRYTRTLHGAAGQPAQAELWLLHGAGHAWAGGQAAGSYTDARGPDASGEMLRFFNSHQRRAA